MLADMDGMSDEGGQEAIEKGNSPPAKPASGWIDRLLWLGPEVDHARATVYGAGQPGFESYDIARQIRDGMARIGEQDKGSWLVLMLNCTVVELLVRSHMARGSCLASLGPLSEADWDNARRVPSMEAAWRTFSPAHVPTLMAMLSTDRVATMTRLSPDEREAFAVALRDFVLNLAEPLDFEAHRLGWALWRRWSRLAIAAVMVAVVVGVVATWLQKVSNVNLALHCHVSASSTNGWAPDANKLVDGITDVMGVHTNGGEQQWVVIDLGAVKKFDRIVVYNRPDCCAERAVPLKVEVSNDNQNYTQIAERTESFDKWTVKNPDAEYRYIRLKNTPPNFLHLAEVEVY
jgi:hypothetical protein